MISWKKTAALRAMKKSGGYVICEDDPEVIVNMVDPEDGELAVFVNGEVRIAALYPRVENDDPKDALIQAIASRLR